MIRSVFTTIFFSFFLYITISAQENNTPAASYTTETNRVNEYRNLVKNSITENLSLPLTDATEENWQSAFTAIELMFYNSPWSDNRIRLAFDSIEKRSIDFQRAALELIYTLQNKTYTSVVSQLMLQSNNNKIFAMCAEYLMLCDNSIPVLSEIKNIYLQKTQTSNNQVDLAILKSLSEHIIDKSRESIREHIDLSPLFAGDYLRPNVVVYSIQRKNRNYPGIAIVKNNDGHFVNGETGHIFSVPQLARSISNLPGYLTNGNTPQGIFRMDGFAVSKSSFIGPTENIQLTMPVEKPDLHFFKETVVPDTIMTMELYEKLLPETLKNYGPLYQSLYAGMAERTEIIAHGTTVNPAYYKDQPYYPLTPTQGCLSTKEIWSTVDGKRTESDQQKLVNAVKAAGGADGYYIVIEIDDQQKPVTIDEILPLLKF